MTKWKPLKMPENGNLENAKNGNLGKCKKWKNGKWKNGKREKCFHFSWVSIFNHVSIFSKVSIFQQKNRNQPKNGMFLFFVVFPFFQQKMETETGGPKMELWKLWVLR